MSDRQRLITKYIGNIPMHFKVMYQLHFLRNETDQAARHMLYENLEKAANNCPHSGINKALKSVYDSKSRNPTIKFGFRPSKDANSLFSSDDSKPSVQQFAVKANSELESLQLENAYIHFKKESKFGGDKYYKQRAEILFVLQHFPKAYELAEKSGLAELIFICALACGKFDAARETIPELTLRVASSTTYVSQAELVQLLLMTSLATESYIETIKLYEKLTSLQIIGEYDYLDAVIPMVEARNYRGIVESAHDFMVLAAQSIYTFNSAEQFTQALIDNVVTNAVAPYAHIPLARLSEIVGLPVDRIVTALVKEIDSGRVDGRLDRVDEVYTAADIDNAPREVVDQYARLAAIRAKVEVGLWRTAHPIKK